MPSQFVEDKGHIFMGDKDSLRSVAEVTLGLLSRFSVSQILVLGLYGPLWAADTVAVSAETFLSSLGVTPHIDQGVSGTSYIEPLRYLGVRNIRDGMRNSSQVELIRRETGVRLDLFCQGGLDVCLTTARGLAKSDALMAIEGPNEPNNFPIVYDGQTGGGMGSWMPIARFQAALYG